MNEDYKKALLIFLIMLNPETLIKWYVENAKKEGDKKPKK